MYLHVSNMRSGIDENLSSCNLRTITKKFHELDHAVACSSTSTEKSFILSYTAILDAEACFVAVRSCWRIAD